MDARHYNHIKLQKAREAAGYTQVQIAEKLKKNSVTISRVETGVAASYDLLCEYSTVLGCDVRDFLYSNMQVAA